MPHPIVSDPPASSDTPRPASLSEWRLSPSSAFSDWIKAQRHLDSTVTVKQAMWNKFIRFLKIHSIALDQCSKDTLEGFFEWKEPKQGKKCGETTAIESIKSEKSEKMGKPIGKGQRFRYVRLIQEVFDYLGSIGFAGQNPGEAARMAQLSQGKNDATRFLTQDEREKLIQGIEAELEKSTLPREGTRVDQWFSVRDAAVTAVMIGAGCRLGEWETLTVNCTVVGDALLIPEVRRSNGTVQVVSHRAFLFPIARVGLEAWRAVRARIPSSSDRLFIAQVEKRNEASRMDSDALHPSTLFRRLRPLLASAGITGKRACGQTLRNTYGAMLIESGADDEVLQECMGFINPESVLRFRRLYAEWAARLFE